MRIETKEIKIYSYNELSENVKKEINKIIEQKIIDDNFEYLKENLLEYLKENHNISDCKLEYSFSYCQGDGCCFYNIRNILSYYRIKNKKDDMNSFEKYIINNYSQNDIELILEYLNSDYCLKLYKSNSNYSHKYTCDIDFEFYYNDNKELENKVNELIEKLVDDLQENVYYTICDEMEEIGYKCYDVTPEEIEEFIDCMGYEFLEDGSIYE